MEPIQTIKIPEFAKVKDRVKWLIENKERLIAQKKSIIKHGDGIPCSPSFRVDTIKAAGAMNEDEAIVKAVINTTNIMDSHDDVHFPGLWNKSLNENKMIMHLQEHKLEFDKIISDGEDLKASTKTFSWKSLGFNFPGTTEALVFDSTVLKSRNEYMFNQYRENRVKNHSVGMQYVKLALAVNDEDYGAEFEVWEKYINQIVNFERAEERGFFWAIKEAKVIEGSAVPLGSNWATPTLEVKEMKPAVDATSINYIISLRDQMSEAEKIRKYFNSLNF